MKSLIIFLFFISLELTSFTQNNMEIQWQACYGGSEDEMEPKVIATEYGYMVLSSTGSNDGDISFNHGSEDFWLVAIDSIGTLLWEKCYGGSNAEVASYIITDSIGHYYIGGWVSSNDGDVQSGNHGGWDRWVVKLNTSGDIIWEKCYGGSYMDYGGSLLLLNNGNILVYSATTSNDGDVPVNYGGLDVWLMIINPDGEILQNKVFGNSDQNNIFKIIQTQDGGFFFTSSADSDEGMVEGEYHGGGDVWVIRLDSLFNIEWQKLYGGSHLDYQSNGVIELEDGYFLLCSTVSNDGDVSGFHGIPGDISTDDIWAIKIDLVGNIIWQRCLGGSKSDCAVDLFHSEDGGFVIVAKTRSNNGDVWDNNSASGYGDIWMVKLSAEGILAWSKCYGGIKTETVFKGGTVKKSDNHYIIAGLTESNTGDVDCNLHSWMEDIWVFEIKDCSLYMPQTPTQPTGPDTLCYTTDSTSMYSINTATGAWGYEWKIEPENAATILQDTLLAYITWNQQYEGEVAVSVRSYNDCGNSDWSEVKTTWVYNCVGIDEFRSNKMAFSIYPNPASSMLNILILKEDNYLIEIFDVFGKKVKEIKIPKGQTKAEVNVEKWRKGLYLVKASNGKNYYGIRKVLIQ